MEQLILFRQGINSLNTREYQQCLELIGRNVLTSIICKMLHHQVMNNKLDNVEEINAIIKQIKESQRTKEIIKENNNNNIDENGDDEEEEKIEIKLDDIPNVLLLEISSFLSFDNKIRFEQTNSSIFIALNENKLPLYSLSDDNFAKLTKYASKCDNINKKKCIPQIKTLTINCDQLVIDDGNYRIRHPFNYFELFDNIQTLEIQCQCGVDIQMMLSHLFEITNLPNLQTLRIIPSPRAISDCFTLYCDEDMSELDRFKDHPNLEFVEVTAWIEPEFFENNYYEWTSSLKGIAITNLSCDPEVEEHIMETTLKSLAIVDNLQSLHISFLSNYGKLNKLKEICLPWHLMFWGDEVRSCKILLKRNANTLERVYFRDIGRELTDDECKETFIQLSLHEMIKNVKYIGLSVSQNRYNMHMKFVLHAMDILIKTLQNMKKNTLQIRIDNMRSNKTDKIGDDFILKLKELTNILNVKCIDWMLIGYNWKVFEDNKLLIDELKIMKNKYDVIHYSTTNSFVIKNKQCKINGYYEPWIMKCYCCQQHALVS